jgi:hypothetical protein
VNRAERRAAERELAKRIQSPPVHIADQLEAASREARPLVDAIEFPGGTSTWSRQPGDEGSSRRLAALHLAARDRIRWMCPHAGPDRAVVQYALLAWGVAICRACVLAGLFPPAVPDTSRCDICGEPPPGGLFRPFVIQSGGTIFAADVGECCLDVFEGVSA